MGEIVNLRRVKKRLAKVRAEVDAAENRVRFGRTKGEKSADAREKVRLESAVDGAQLDRSLTDIE